jgi:rfaE bifunctional protein kinase chain/domain
VSAELPLWPSLRILVAGDLILDTYGIGHVSRQSPEAAVEVLDLFEWQHRVGGSGNVALNLAGLGLDVHLLATVGQDPEAAILRDLLQNAGISDRFLGSLLDVPTTHKTRFLDGKRHLLRVDREQRNPQHPAIDLLLEQGLDLALEGCDAMVLQDYEKGFFNPERIARFIQKGRERGIPICVDPKYLHFWEFKGVDLFKPNLKELEQALDRKIQTESSDLEEACAEARERLSCRLLLVTMADQGLCWMDEQGFGRLQTSPVEVVDVCGAGDSVIAAATCAYASGMAVLDIAAWSNLCGGLACLKSGTQPLVLAEVLSHLNSRPS